MVMVKPIASEIAGRRESTTVPKMTRTGKNEISTSMIAASMMETSGPSREVRGGQVRWRSRQLGADMPPTVWSPSVHGIDEPDGGRSAPVRGPSLLRPRDPRTRSSRPPVSEGEGHVSGRTVQHQGRSQQGVAVTPLRACRYDSESDGGGSRPASRWSPRSRAHRPRRSRCPRSIAVGADGDRAVRQELHGVERCGNRPYAWKIDQRPDERRHGADTLRRRLHPQPVARRQRPGPRCGTRAAQQQQRQHAGPEYASRHGSSSLPGATGHCRHPHCIMPGSTTCGRLWPFRRTVPPTSPAATLQTPAAHSSWPAGWVGRSSPKSWPTRSEQPTMAADPMSAHARSSRANVSRGATMTQRSGRGQPRSWVALLAALSGRRSSTAREAQGRADVAIVDVAYQPGASRSRPEILSPGRTPGPHHTR